MKALITCIVAGIQYLVHPQILGSIEETIKPDALLPITLLTTDEIFGDIDGLLQLLDSIDDVFNPEFGGILVEKPSMDSDRTSSYVTIEINGTTRPVYHLNEITAQKNDLAELPSGPYFLQGPNLHQAWRLYDDELEAFTFGVVPENVTDPDSYEVVNALSPQGNFKAVPAPSRLYHPKPSLSKPLSGLRFAIDDSLTLRGAPSTYSSRAWSALHPYGVNLTVDYVQDIIDQGAVIIGKTKVTQFGMLGIDGEWIDEQQPWNPRGDGHQKVSGSSPGATAALMGYDWMDHAVGRSVYANQEGLYSLTYDRYSYGYFPPRTRSNIILFSRTLDGLAHLAPTPRTYTEPILPFPKKILWPTDLMADLPIGYEYVMSQFLDMLEKFLNVTTKPINLADSWATLAEKTPNDPNLQRYMKDGFHRMKAFEFVHSLENFEADYVQEFGRKPYLEPTPQFLWDTGKNVTFNEYILQRRRLMTFKVWFNTYIMHNMQHWCDAIMVLPCDAPEEPGSRYRDGPNSPPTAFQGVTPKTLGQLLWVTQLTVPFTQIPYKSRVSGGDEFVPFCASILGFRDSEKMLVKLVKEAFEAADWPVQVKTGRLAFPVNGHIKALDKQDGMKVQDPPQGEL